MNTDIRLKLSFRNHPKTKKLRLKLGAEGVLSFIWLLMFAAESRSDGDLLNLDAEDLALAADWSGDADEFAAVLVDVGLIDKTEAGWLIHDWSTHNAWAAGARSRSEKARNNASKKWGAESNAKQTRAERLKAAREKGSHTSADWEKILAACKYRCAKCSTVENIVKNHIVPIYQGGSDGPENLQPLCSSCNSSKGPDTTDHRIGVVPNLWKLLHNGCKVPAKRLHDACGMPAPSPSPSPSPSPKQLQPIIELPSWIDPEIWKEYEQHRRELRHAATPTAAKRIIAKLERFMNEHQVDPNEAIKLSIENNYRGVFPEKVLKERQREGNQPSQQTGRGTSASRRADAADRKRAHIQAIT